MINKEVEIREALKEHGAHLAFEKTSNQIECVIDEILTVELTEEKIEQLEIMEGLNALLLEDVAKIERLLKECSQAIQIKVEPMNEEG